MEKRVIKFKYFKKSDKIIVESLGAIGVEQAVNDDRFVVIQYTGLNDWYGKEIYEGDILRMTVEELKDAPHVYYFYEVRWHVCSFALFVDNKRISDLNPIITNSVEVIGSIYTNPELIKNGK